MKHLFLSMSVTQNLFVSVFLHKCLMNDVEDTRFKMFVTQISNYLFVNYFQLMFSQRIKGIVMNYNLFHNTSCQRDAYSF